MIRKCTQVLVPLAAAALALTACSSRAADSAAAPAAANAPDRKADVHPVSGLPVVDLAITHAGKVHHFRVEVAQSGAEQERGLMFRTAMGADEGMIFPMAPPRLASFWMRNTVIPLDIIFVGTNGRILNIAAQAIPYDETPLNSVGPVKGVLELNGGRAAALGLRAGDALTW